VPENIPTRVIMLKAMISTVVSTTGGLNKRGRGIRPIAQETPEPKSTPIIPAEKVIIRA